MIDNNSPCKRCREYEIQLVLFEQRNDHFLIPFALELYDFHKKSNSCEKRIRIKIRNKVNKYFITLTAGGKGKEYIQAIRKILHYKKFSVVNGYGVIELTKNDEPHAHIYIESKDYIKHERIKRIWKKSYSQIKNVKFDNGIMKYCDKDENNEKLLEYCKKNNIPRVVRFEEEE